MFTLPVFVWTFPPTKVLKVVTLLSVVSTLFTAPWSAYMISTGAKSFGADRHMSEMIPFGGRVPIEEYLFFVLQTFIVCGLFMDMLPEGAEIKPLPRTWSRIPLLLASVPLCGITAYICTTHFHLGAVLLFGLPATLFQLAYRMETLWEYRWSIAKCVGVCTVYLSVVNHWAMARGTWFVEDTAGDAYPGLPVEEVLAPGVNSFLCCVGFVVLMTVMEDVRELIMGRRKKQV